MRLWRRLRHWWKARHMPDVDEDEPRVLDEVEESQRLRSELKSRRLERDEINLALRELQLRILNEQGRRK